MIRLLSILALFIAIFLAFSCSQNGSQKEISSIKVRSDSPREKVSITKIRPKTINSVQASQNLFVAYRNTSISKKKIGEFINVQLNEIPGLTIDSVQQESIFKAETKYGKFFKYSTTKWQINLIFDNDIFANRDYYYTNGLRIEIAAPFFNKSSINKILIGSKNPDVELSGISITQNIYTPTNPDTLVILYGDRPFAAVLMLGHFREVYKLSKKLHIRSELNIGVIGPASFGQEVQSSIHEIEPVGWPNQIGNDLVINYSLRVDKGLISSPNVELNAVGKASIGTLQNKGGGGLNLRLGNFMPVYRGPFSFFENKNPGGRYQFWFFLEGLVDFVAYDATMQGGLFNSNNPYSIPVQDINRVVFQASGGFALYYNSIGIEYEHFYQTPEFKGAYHFGWGRLKFVLAF